MAGALALAARRARRRGDVLARLGLREQGYLLATVHRAENTDDVARLKQILTALEAVGEPVLLPLHPRTRKALRAFMPTDTSLLQYVEPVGYLDMVALEQGARLILTDSGGIQKEAYWLGVPCITLRDETEWVETVRAGWNMLVGADTARIIGAVRNFAPPSARPELYGDAHAAQRIVALL